MLAGIVNKNITSIVRNRTTSESQNMYAETETDELLAMLRETESLDEQGDILQYLVDTQGLEFNTGKDLPWVVEVPLIQLRIHE